MTTRYSHAGIKYRIGQTVSIARDCFRDDQPHIGRIVKILPYGRNVLYKVKTTDGRIGYAHEKEIVP